MNVVLKTAVKLVLALSVVLAMPVAFAQDSGPEQTIRKVSDEVIGVLKADTKPLAGKQAELHALVDARVLPHFDFAHMTRLAMGRNWTKATAEQQTRLTDEFRTLLVRTYSGALSSFEDPVIGFKSRQASATDTEVTVRTQVRQTGRLPVNIDYGMLKTPAGWKVFDVVVEGISLVTNYRGTFDAAIRADGVDGLIRILVEKNGAKNDAKNDAKNGAPDLQAARR